MTSAKGLAAFLPSTQNEPATGRLAILVSGGLDSAILLGEALPHFPAVYPLYVRHGLFWEAAELQFLRRDEVDLTHLAEGAS